MKKQYINPELTVINVSTQSIMEASAGFGSGTKSGGDAASRYHNSLWDSDDDDWLLDDDDDYGF